MLPAEDASDEALNLEGGRLYTNLIPLSGVGPRHNHQLWGHHTFRYSTVHTESDVSIAHKPIEEFAKEGRESRQRFVYSDAI